MSTTIQSAGPRQGALSREEAIALVTGQGQLLELVTAEIDGRLERVFAHGPQTLRDLYEQTSSDLTFFVYNEERLSFRQGLEKASGIAHLLVGRFGVGKGDRVAIAMRNYPEWALSFSAITSIGAIAVAMNALWRPEEMAFALRDSGAKVLIADQARLNQFVHAGADSDVVAIVVRPEGPTSSVADLAILLAETPGAPMPTRHIAPDDPATLFYTSGSTGRPKGVLSTHRNILAALLSWEVEGQVTALMSDVETPPMTSQAATLLAVPLFHVSGSHAAYLASYRAQRKIVSLYKWDPEAAMAAIEREAITSVVAPAAITGDLVRAARHTRFDLSSLLAIGGGGAPRAAEQVAQIEATFSKAQPGTSWGMTETNAIGTTLGGATYLARPTSSGRCSAVLDLKIVGPSGETLSAGERGELAVCGTAVFRRYWNRPEVDAEVFRDGWFLTGDVAYLDVEGFLFIVDRVKDLIIRGGENIGCGHVEDALLKHPQVHEAGVYAVPDERLGEEVGATLWVDPNIDEDALRNLLGEHLAAFEIPRYFHYVQTPLPRTPSGKIWKEKLKKEGLNFFDRQRIQRNISRSEDLGHESKLRGD